MGFEFLSFLFCLGSVRGSRHERLGFQLFPYSLSEFSCLYRYDGRLDVADAGFHQVMSFFLVTEGTLFRFVVDSKYTEVSLFKTQLIDVG